MSRLEWGIWLLLRGVQIHRIERWNNTCPHGGPGESSCARNYISQYLVLSRQGVARKVSSANYVFLFLSNPIRDREVRALNLTDIGFFSGEQSTRRPSDFSRLQSIFLSLYPVFPLWLIYLTVLCDMHAFAFTITSYSMYYIYFTSEELLKWI